VEDVVAANLLLTRAELPPAKSIDQRGFNVGTGTETSVNELVRLLQEASGIQVPIEYAPARPGELLHSSLDAGKLRALGWEPRTPLLDGLGSTFRWIEAHR
jgi:UDP-glucose 4-epimerase